MNATASTLHRASLSRLAAQRLAALRAPLGRLGLAALSMQHLGDSIPSDIIHALQHFIFNGLQVGICQVGELARARQALNDHFRDFTVRAKI